MFAFQQYLVEADGAERDELTWLESWVENEMRHQVEVLLGHYKLFYMQDSRKLFLAIDYLTLSSNYSPLKMEPSSAPVLQLQHFLGLAENIRALHKIPSFLIIFSSYFNFWLLIVLCTLPLLVIFYYTQYHGFTCTVPPKCLKFLFP